MNTLMAIATAKTIVKRYPLLEKYNIEIGRFWVQSLFRLLGFVRGMKTMGKVRIPVGA